MAGYSIKLSKELKESLASEFDSNWDSDRDDPDVVEPPPHPAQQNTATPRENGGHGSVSSESSSDGKELEEEKDVDGKRRSKSIGSRLKRILSTGTYLT